MASRDCSGNRYKVLLALQLWFRSNTCTTLRMHCYREPSGPLAHQAYRRATPGCQPARPVPSGMPSSPDRSWCAAARGWISAIWGSSPRAVAACRSRSPIPSLPPVASVRGMPRLEPSRQARLILAPAASTVKLHRAYSPVADDRSDEVLTTAQAHDTF